jgi:hypothetical protein
LSFQSNQSFQKTDGIIIIDHWFSKKYKYRREEEEEQSHVNQTKENVNNSVKYMYVIDNKLVE